MAPTEALPLTISNPYVPYKAPDKASAFALRYVFLVVPVMFGFDPNITGQVRFSARCFGEIVNPAFSGESLGNQYELYGSVASTLKYDYLKIDLSSGSNLYKNSSGVQPSAFQTLIIIKT